MEARRQDTMIRKQPRHIIRKDSWDDPTKQESLMARLAHNEAIIDASIRQAQRKAQERQTQNLEQITLAKKVLGTYEA